MHISKCRFCLGMTRRSSPAINMYTTEHYVTVVVFLRRGLFIIFHIYFMSLLKYRNIAEWMSVCFLHVFLHCAFVHLISLPPRNSSAKNFSHFLSLIHIPVFPSPSPGLSYDVCIGGIILNFPQHLTRPAFVNNFRNNAPIYNFWDKNGT